MSDKMVSSYQVLLDVPQYDTGLSDMIFDTHSLYMRAADVMSEVSLNIWGSIKARYIPDNVKIDHAELCFVSWFSVEEVAATPKEKQLNRTEIVARFKKYWHEDAALNDAKLDDNTIQLFAFAPIMIWISYLIIQSSLTQRSVIATFFCVGFILTNMALVRKTIRNPRLSFTPNCCQKTFGVTQTLFLTN
jgi:hypothetical protein